MVITFVVNVEVYLHRDGRWLLIRRGAEEAHAPGTLAGPGGKVELPADAEPGLDILETTGAREVLEEVGVRVSTLSYVESVYFRSDSGNPVVNVVFAGPMPDGEQPYIASVDEVAGLEWLTCEEALADCPPWTERALRKAERLRIDGHL